MNEEAIFYNARKWRSLPLRAILLYGVVLAGVTLYGTSTINAILTQSKFPEDALNEQEIVTLSFGEEGFSMPNGKPVGYVFFVPRNDSSSNRVECADFAHDDYNDWKRGVAVFAGEQTAGPFTMSLLDNNKTMSERMGYDIVVRTAAYWDDGVPVPEWASQGFSFGVTNVVPEVTEVSMNGMNGENGGAMMAHAILGVPKTFKAYTSEPSDFDFYADEDNNYQDHSKAFATEWRFDYGAGTSDVRYSYGPPSTGFTYAFVMVGTCQVTVRMRDKDMDHERGEWGPEFTFKVIVDAKPAISLSPANGLTMFYEDSIGQYSKIKVGLSMAPEEEITVHLDVRRVGTDDGNYPLPVLNSYDITFGGASPYTTEAAVWFTELDGTSLGECQGYNITAVVTNTTLNADGVAWTNLYRSAELPITVANLSPRILTSPSTLPRQCCRKQHFSISYSMQDVLADMAAGISMTWQTSEGYSTNYMVAASGSGQYVTYRSSSPDLSFNSVGLKTVTLLVQDKDGGYDVKTWYYEVPEFDVTITDGETDLIVDGYWIADTFGLTESWVHEHPTEVNSIMTGEAANGRKVWECYVLGLDPEKTNDFRITSFPMNADGTPDLANVVFDPPQWNWNSPDAQPVLKGAASLDGGEWQTVTDENKAMFRFFKVVVELP